MARARGAVRWGIAVGLSVVLLELALTAAWPRPDPIPSTPSVTLVGYDALRGGVARAGLSVERYEPLAAERVPYARRARRAMPLYVNGALDPVPGLGDRKVLFFLEPRKVVALDLERGRRLWWVKTEWVTTGQAPVIDLARGRLYFTTHRMSKEARPGAWTQPTFRLRLHAIGLDGRGLHGFEIDLDGLLHSDRLSPDAPPSSLLRCRTALGLDPSPASPSVFFGCGVRLARGPTPYSASRGARGLLVVARRDAAGDLIGPNAVAGYSPSAIGDDPHTGFDTGVWNAGAGPSLLPDGSFLIATGNGPVLPEQGNYGCSVVRIDGTTLAPRDVGPSPPFLSIDDPGYAECHAMNTDLACSSVASLGVGDRILSAITGKDGRLRVFDPDDLPGGDPRRKVEVAVGGLHCGQPSIRGDAGDVRVITGGSRGAKGARRMGGDWVLATARQAELLEAEGHERGPCLGWIRAQPPSPGGRALVLHFSGPLRDDYVLLTEGSPLGAAIASGRFEFASIEEAAGGDKTGRLAPYRPVATVGYALAGSDPVLERVPSGYEAVSLALYARSEGGLYSFPASLSQPEILTPGRPFEVRPVRGRVPMEPDFGLVLVPKERDETGLCGRPPAPGLERLHVFRRPRRPDFQGWVVSAFHVGPGLRLERRWVVEGNDGHDAPVSNLVTTAPLDGGTGLVVFPVVGADASRLILLDVETGARVDAVPFEGAPHFTMPLVVGDRIVVATRNEGLKMFRPRRAPVARYLARSRLIGALVGGVRR